MEKRKKIVAIRQSCYRAEADIVEINAWSNFGMGISLGFLLGEITSLSKRVDFLLF